MRTLALTVALLAIPAAIPAAVLDFEGFTVGTFLADEYQASAGIVFEENARIHFLGGGHATSGIHGLFNAGSIISARFMLPGNIPAVTDSVSIKGDRIPIPGNVTLQAYDINGNLVDDDVRPDVGPTVLSAAGSGIHRIVFFAETRTVAFDDLSFNTPVAAPAQTVPEPATAMLLLCGVAGLIALRRT